MAGNHYNGLIRKLEQLADEFEAAADTGGEEAAMDARSLRAAAERLRRQPCEHFPTERTATVTPCLNCGANLGQTWVVVG